MLITAWKTRQPGFTSNYILLWTTHTNNFQTSLSTFPSPTSPHPNPWDISQLTHRRQSEPSQVKPSQANADPGLPDRVGWFARQGWRFLHQPLLLYSEIAEQQTPNDFRHIKFTKALTNTPNKIQPALHHAQPALHRSNTVGQ